MALWPFRRKSGRKRSRSGATLSDLDAGAPVGPASAHARSQTAHDVSAQRSLSKKRRTEPNKLQRRPRTYSFSPGRSDAINIQGRRVSGQAGAAGRTGSNLAGVHADGAGGEWHRVPTLHVKDGHHKPRRKSSKRKREDLDREAEIKKMANFRPLRPATEQWLAGRPMKRDTPRRAATGQDFPKHWENPSSEISLPTPESIHSSLSSDSEYGSYKISALASLAPRPTLRYTVYPRWPQPNDSAPTRTSSQKRKLSERNIPEATIKAHKRIDDLADDFDASDLRELMERDKRRRERKKLREKERAERRLARRAEKQKEEEEESRKTGTPPPQNLERGVAGRELVGLGIDDATSAVITSSRRRSSETKVPAEEATRATNRSPSPLAEFHRTTSMPPEPEAEPQAETVEPAEPDTQAEAPLPSPPRSPKFGFLRTKKSRSKSSLASVSEKEKMVAPTPPPDIAEEDEGAAREPAQKSRRISLSALFKWAAKAKRPPSFSNTSREEMQAAAQSESQISSQAAAPPATSQEALPPAAAPNYVASRKTGPAAPKRTRSRFREDLPDFPVSPPESRVQSPEAVPPLPAVSEFRNDPMQIDDRSTQRFDTPTSGHRTLDEAVRQTPTSWRAYPNHSPEPQSMSLASIDSEASWLSGRIGGARRPSSARDTHSRTQHRRVHSNGAESSADEDMAIAEDDYLSRVASPQPSSPVHANRQSTGEARPSSDEDEPMEDSDMKWGAVGARQQPRMVHEHDARMMKSREGLLNSYAEEDESSGAASKDEADDQDQEDHSPGGLHRATSVNLGKGHARHISAGSAKLLELTPRPSSDAQRRSSDNRSSGIALV